jgi:hypothetical protein
MTALADLAAELRAGGGLLAEAVVDPPDQPTPHGDAVAARGPEYALLVEAIREGYLLHYGTGRVVATGDRDLALLAGDRLYALGLERLADLGDLEGTAILADVISLCAKAHAEGEPARAERAWADGLSRLAG